MRREYHLIHQNHTVRAVTQIGPETTILTTKRIIVIPVEMILRLRQRVSRFVITVAKNWTDGKRHLGPHDGKTLDRSCCKSVLRTDLQSWQFELSIFVDSIVTPLCLIQTKRWFNVRFYPTAQQIVLCCTRIRLKWWWVVRRKTDDMIGTSLAIARSMAARLAPVREISGTGPVNCSSVSILYYQQWCFMSRF